MSELLPLIGVREGGGAMSWSAAPLRPASSSRRVGGTLALLLGALAVLSGCRAQTGLLGPDRSVSYDHRASAVVIEFVLLPPYNPAAQATGWSVSVRGDGSVLHSGRPARGSGRISGARLQALLQQMWDDGLFAEPALGERTYDAGEETLVATANSTWTELVLSSMSPPDNASVVATRSAIDALLRATG